MKSKRQMVIIIVVLTFMNVAAHAQGRGMRSPEERANLLKEQLTLTDGQTAKVQKIFEDGQKQMQEMMSANTGNRDAMRKAFMETAAKQDSLIEKLLTKEQLMKYETLKKERRQRMQQNRRDE